MPEVINGNKMNIIKQKYQLNNRTKYHYYIKPENPTRRVGKSIVGDYSLDREYSAEEIFKPKNKFGRKQFIESML